MGKTGADRKAPLRGVIQPTGREHCLALVGFAPWGKLKSLKMCITVVSLVGLHAEVRTYRPG